jgi:hypothetical protein
MIRNILGTFATALVFCLCALQANADFYLRPSVQISSLVDSHAETDPGLGVGLALGSALGQQHNYEVGAECNLVRYEGDFDKSTRLAGSNWTKVPSECAVANIMGTFRYSFGSKFDNLRPYLGMGAGFSWLDISNSSTEGGRQATCWTGSVGGGLSYRLGRLTCVEFGYRFVFSDTVSYGIASNFSYNFRYNAHVLAITIDQRFGRGGATR